MTDDPESFYTDDFMFDIMGVKALPTTLFQYTSIDSLGKILASRSLRFSRLDTMNDPEEATSADVPLAATSVFVSCWSADKVERIPMWSMYGAHFEGVRIGLPINMFAGRETPKVFEKGGAFSSFDGQFSIARKEPALGTNGRCIIGPNKICYSNDPKYRNRKLVHRTGGKAHFTPYDLGMVKSTYWAYEEEWRFKIAAVSTETQFPDDRYFNEVTLDFANFPVETEALFVPLDPTALDELEVIVGPRAGTKVIAELEHILGDHAPQAKLTQSQIAFR
ncbi:DUF2971 domain-containing protein [Roseibium sp. LAB1]